jgi:hypothetical protein
MRSGQRQKLRSKLNLTGNQQDCLGHVLQYLIYTEEEDESDRDQTHQLMEEEQIQN